MNKIYISILAIAFIFACGQNDTGKEMKKERKKIKKNTELTNSITETTKKKIATTPRRKTAHKEGRKLFLLCEACHSLNKDGDNKVGPNLHGFMATKAGTKDDFKYTENLISSGIVWNEDNLRKWIENPAKLVPGTSMAFIGIKQKERQDQLIAYLIEQTK